MSSDPSVLSRFGGTKVRTGCLTCKARHIKCNERKPACTRCIKSRLICRYAEPMAQSLRMVHYVSTPEDFQSLDPMERLYLHHFRTKTGPQLAGVHSPEFWLHHAISIATVEPAVKHAVIALSALHRQSLESNDMLLMGVDPTYPLRQYTKAIGILSDNMRTAPSKYLDAPLIACMLFCAFESMSYHLHSAISHATSGLKILAEQQRGWGKPANVQVPSHVLSPLYTKLDTQGLELGETSNPPQHWLNDPMSTIFTNFRTVHELQNMFDGLTNAILHAIHITDTQPIKEAKPGPDCLESAYPNLLGRLRSWCDVFDKFVSEEVPRGQLAACLLMQLWRILVNINLQVDLRKGEMDFDRFDADFRAIGDLAFEFLVIESEQQFLPELVDAHNTSSADGETLVLHRCSASEGGLRSGYLGVQPRHTPFVAATVVDKCNVEESTNRLLETARSSRKHYLHNSDRGSASSWTSKPSYSFSSGIVSPLYVTISRCRDPSIRRRGLLLLQKCKRREGLWDSALAARLGQRVMEIEERRARELNSYVSETSTTFRDGSAITPASQIPNEARVRMVKPTFLPGRQSIERYYLGWSDPLDETQDMTETWIEEVMEW